MTRVKPVQCPTAVFVIRYTNKMLRKLLKDSRIGNIHYFISELVIHSERYPYYRVQLELRNRQNTSNCLRRANLFELIYFAQRNPDFVLEYGPIQGHDDNIIQTGKRLGTPFIIPYVAINPNSRKIEVLLSTEDEPLGGEYKLIATLWHNMC